MKFMFEIVHYCELLRRRLKSLSQGDVAINRPVKSRHCLAKLDQIGAFFHVL